MQFNIITNYNGVGLEQDANIISDFLTSLEHQTNKIQYTSKFLPQADVNIFLEVLVPNILRCSKQSWFVPNPEWCFPHWDLKCFSHILCKTRDTVRIYNPGNPGRCHYTGWMARDLYRPEVTREKRFLHVAGKSRLKNTESVIVGARLAGVPLTLVSSWYPGHQYITEHELIQQFNSHRFFLCPSAAEGYGMALHEALGCGAIIITTNAPPMNEIHPACLLQSNGHRPLNMGMTWSVTPEAIQVGINSMLSLSDGEIADLSKLARGAYLTEVTEFKQRMTQLLGGV